MPNPLALSPLSKHDAASICSWRYEPPYDCYQFSSWQQLCDEEREFANDEIRQQQYRALYADGQFIGFVQLFPLLNVIRLGIFLAPSYCNIGWGRYAVMSAVAEAQTLYPSAKIDLEVECWNKRAIACYKKCDFVITDQYDYPYQGSIKQVYCMVYMKDNKIK